MPRLGDVVAALESLYDPSWAEPWDAVGLVCGDPDADVRRVLFAVDPVTVVAAEAVQSGVQLLVTHHPLFLRPVHGVPASDPKGRVVHRLLAAGVALYVAHTNADAADPGVSDALAATLGLRDLTPLAPAEGDAEDKIVTFVPAAETERVIDALAGAGAGGIGGYRRCAYTVAGTGTFLPGENTAPVIGSRGVVERVAEMRVEMVVPRARRAAVVRALRAAHPYEEPAYDVYELAARPPGRGTGRIGVLPHAETLQQFAHRVAAALPATPAGLRVAGDAGRQVRTVAVCGGAGDSLLDAARHAGVDAYVTADLRHHRASEALEAGGPALVDAAHWATEWPWLADAARRLRAVLRDGERGGGATVETSVSGIVTDPWTSHATSRSLR